MHHSKLVSRGFDVEIVTERLYTVICVTKRSKDQKHYTYHLPVENPTSHIEDLPTAEVKVRNLIATRNDITLYATDVVFDDKEYEIYYVGKGLDGSALVFGIEVTDAKYGVWDLYTDTPCGDPDHPDWDNTPEAIRQRACKRIGAPDDGYKSSAAREREMELNRASFERGAELFNKLTGGE